jgi:hypothetical protein
MNVGERGIGTFTKGSFENRFNEEFMLVAKWWVDLDEDKIEKLDEATKIFVRKIKGGAEE